MAFDEKEAEKQIPDVSKIERTEYYAQQKRAEQQYDKTFGKAKNLLNKLHPNWRFDAKWIAALNYEPENLFQMLRAEEEILLEEELKKFVGTPKKREKKDKLMEELGL